MAIGGRYIVMVNGSGGRALGVAVGNAVLMAGGAGALSNGAVEARTHSNGKILKYLYSLRLMAGCKMNAYVRPG